MMVVYSAVSHVTPKGPIVVKMGCDLMSVKAKAYGIHIIFIQIKPLCDSLCALWKSTFSMILHKTCAFDFSPDN